MSYDRPDPFTTFIGPNKGTYTVEAHFPEEISQVAVSTNYEPGAGPRKRYFGKVEDQIKHILEGTLGEEAELPANSRLAAALPSLYRIEPTTGERILAVELHEIEHVFTPSESLALIFLERVPIPLKVSRKVQKAVGYLMSLGISFNALGLYGGLASFVAHKDQHTPIKDIDILVYGLEYVPLLVEVAELNQKFKQGNGKNTRVRAVNQDIRKMRHLYTRIFIPDDTSGLFCDIKVVRASGDRQSLTKEIIARQETVVVDGMVVDALEALSNPMSFMVQDGYGRIITVSSTRYNYIGAVKKGDCVKVTGRMTNDPNHIMLVDQDRDLIEYYPQVIQ